MMAVRIQGGERHASVTAHSSEAAGMSGQLLRARRHPFKMQIKKGGGGEREERKRLRCSDDGQIIYTYSQSNLEMPHREQPTLHKPWQRHVRTSTQRADHTFFHRTQNSAGADRHHGGQDPGRRAHASVTAQSSEAASTSGQLLRAKGHPVLPVEHCAVYQPTGWH